MNKQDKRIKELEQELKEQLKVNEINDIKLMLLFIICITLVMSMFITGSATEKEKDSLKQELNSTYKALEICVNRYVPTYDYISGWVVINKSWEFERPLTFNISEIPDDVVIEDAILYFRLGEEEYTYETFIRGPLD